VSANLFCLEADLGAAAEFDRRRPARAHFFHLPNLGPIQTLALVVLGA